MSLRHIVSIRESIEKDFRQIEPKFLGLRSAFPDNPDEELKKLFAHAPRENYEKRVYAFCGCVTKARCHFDSFSIPDIIKSLEYIEASPTPDALGTLLNLLGKPFLKTKEKVHLKKFFIFSFRIFRVKQKDYLKALAQCGSDFIQGKNRERVEECIKRYFLEEEVYVLHDIFQNLLLLSEEAKSMLKEFKIEIKNHLHKLLRKEHFKFYPHSVNAKLSGKISITITPNLTNRRKAGIKHLNELSSSVLKKMNNKKENMRRFALNLFSEIFREPDNLFTQVYGRSVSFNLELIINLHESHGAAYVKNRSFSNYSKRHKVFVQSSDNWKNLRIFFSFDNPSFGSYSDFRSILLHELAHLYDRVEITRPEFDPKQTLEKIRKEGLAEFDGLINGGDVFYIRFAKILFTEKIKTEKEIQAEVKDSRLQFYYIVGEFFFVFLFTKYLNATINFFDEAQVKDLIRQNSDKAKVFLRIMRGLSIENFYRYLLNKSGDKDCFPIDRTLIKKIIEK